MPAPPRFPWRRCAATLVALSLIAVACGSVEPAPPGVSEFTLEIDGVERSYTLFVPSASESTTGAPLLLNFHGGADDAAGQMAYSDFNTTAEAEGVVVAYPDGIDRFWNFDDADVEFVAAVVDDVFARTSIDPSRVYLTGMSIGADFASFLTCADPGRYAALAAVAVLNHHNPPFCPERRPTPVIAVAGATDDISIFGVREAIEGQDVPGPLAEEIREWATTNGCDENPPVGTEDNLVRSVFDCADGLALEVVLHRGGHIWPQADDGLDTNVTIWNFLSHYSSS